jgi:sugar-specific transcriptional regulator TrmB
MENKLNEIGLNEYEKKVYVDLVRNGASTGGKIVKRSGVPQGKVYQVIQSLQDKGFLTTTDVKPKIFTPVNPEIAVKDVIENKIENLSRLKKEVLEEFKAIKKPEIESNILEKIQVFSGKKPRYALNDRLFENAKKEVRFMHTYEVRFYSFVRLVNETAKRGIKVKFLAISVNEKTLEWMKEDIRDGVEVRYFPVDDIRIQVMDEEESRVSVVNPKDTRDRVTIYFHHGEMSKHLKSYFDTLWNKAKKVNLKTKISDLVG